MRKISMLLGMVLLCCFALSSHAQTNPTITFIPPAPAVDGQPQTITVQGELPTAHLDATSISNSLVFHVHADPDNAIPEYFSLTNFSVTPYNCATGSPTKINFTFTRNVAGNPSIATVQLPMEADFTTKFFNCNGTTGTTVNAYVAPFTAYPAGHTTFSSAAITMTLTRTNCTPPSTGIPFSKTLAAGNNTSSTSQADADAQALAFYNANKAAWANTGSCTVVNPGINFPVTNTSGNALSITFQKNDLSIPNINGVIQAGASGSFTIPPGNYRVTISPAAMPVACNMTFSNGQSALNTPGFNFPSVNIGPGSGTNPASSLSVTRP